MKKFETTGDGPHGQWRTPEERRAGEERLRLDFVAAIRRAMGPERFRLSALLTIVGLDDDLYETWLQIHWEYGGVTPTAQRMAKLLKLMEGVPPHRINQRWSAAEHRMLWGFDPE